MALLYVAICGGEELTVIVRVKLFPVTRNSALGLLINDVNIFPVTGDNTIGLFVTTLTHFSVIS
jgi:hypothetical protein